MVSSGTSGLIRLDGIIVSIPAGQAGGMVYGLPQTSACMQTATARVRYSKGAVAHYLHPYIG